MKKGLLVLPLLLVFLFSRCNFTEDIKTLQGAFDSLQVVVGTPQFNTSVVLQFFDAKTEALIRDKKISVTISGKNATDVYSNIGIRETVFSTTLGLLPLVIDPKVVDTVAMKTTPIQFEITINVDGYLSSVHNVKINEAKMNTLQIMLISTANPPQGVSIAVNNNYTVASLSGQTLSPSIQSLNLGKQTVSIPTGTVLKDASGNPITGTVKSEIVYYDPVSEAAQNAFPGGRTVTATLPDGTEGSIEFISAGMFSINLTSGDKEVKTLENGGIKLRTVVPRTLINPKTGQLIKAGDLIEMWSKEDNTSEWVYEKTSIVKEDNGELILEESVNHLSTWNWDFFNNNCNSGATFLFKGNLSNESVQVKITTRKPNRNTDETKIHYLTTDRKLQLTYVPVNTSATFTFEDNVKDPSRRITFTPSSLNVSDLCSNQIYEIQVSESIPAPDEIVTVNFNVSATSKTNSNFIIKPTMILFQEDERSSTNDFSFYIPNFILLINGEGFASFNYDKDYIISGSLGNSSGKGTLRLEKMPNSKVRVIMTPTIDFSGNTQSTKVTLEFDRTGNNVVNLNYNAVLPESLMNRLL